MVWLSGLAHLGFRVKGLGVAIGLVPLLPLNSPAALPLQLLLPYSCYSLEGGVYVCVGALCNFTKPEPHMFTHVRTVSAAANLICGRLAAELEMY